MWYNENVKIVVSRSAVNTSGLIHLTGDAPMTTLPHYAQKGNFHFVYELVDPRDMSVFYVGITIDLYARFKQHMQGDGTNALKNQRIQEILASGHLPIMRTRERVGSFEQALDREAHWIRYYLSQGMPLLNISGVPEDPAKPRIKVYKPYQIYPKQLFFHSCTGRIVSVHRATDQEFDEFIKRYVDVEENPRYPGWPDHQRRRFIAAALNIGANLEFCKAVEEDDSVYVKRRY